MVRMLRVRAEQLRGRARRRGFLGSLFGRSGLAPQPAGTLRPTD
jgi:hypothetical protein